MALKVRVTQDRSFSRTIHLDGRLDHDSVAVLDSELDKLGDQPVEVLIYDLAGAEYISSAGLRSIFAARKAGPEQFRRLVLMNAQPPVQKVLDLIKAVDLAAVFGSVEELDRHLDAIQRKVVDGSSI
jgi:anti-anti-sigma factor